MFQAFDTITFKIDFICIKLFGENLIKYFQIIFKDLQNIKKMCLKYFFFNLFECFWVDTKVFYDG